MASAYRPRHNGKPKYRKQKSLTPNKITNHPPTNKSTHTYLTQLDRTTLVLPNRTITNVITITSKIYPTIHNKIRYISQYTPHHIKDKYNLLQMHLKHKMHQKSNYHPHTSTTQHLLPTWHLIPTPKLELVLNVNLFWNHIEGAISIYSLHIHKPTPIKNLVVTQSTSHPYTNIHVTLTQQKRTNPTSPAT